MEPPPSMAVLKCLLEIGEADTRSAQKIPAGVLVVRRGLFFVKRQRRCPHISKSIFSKDVWGGGIILLLFILSSIFPFPHKNNDLLYEFIAHAVGTSV